MAPIGLRVVTCVASRAASAAARSAARTSTGTEASATHCCTRGQAGLAINKFSEGTHVVLRANAPVHRRGRCNGAVSRETRMRPRSWCKRLVRRQLADSHAGRLRNPLDSLIDQPSNVTIGHMSIVSPVGEWKNRANVPSSSIRTSLRDNSSRSKRACAALTGGSVQRQARAVPVRGNEHQSGPIVVAAPQTASAPGSVTLPRPHHHEHGVGSEAGRRAIDIVAEARMRLVDERTVTLVRPWLCDCCSHGDPSPAAERLRHLPAGCKERDVSKKP